jgi:hypothetical protein
MVDYQRTHKEACYDDGDSEGDEDAIQCDDLRACIVMGDIGIVGIQGDECFHVQKTALRLRDLMSGMSKRTALRRVDL